MLARTWSGPEATAIWVELVESRRRDIQDYQDPNQISGMAARVAAEQSISRAELARWDSSARAWLLCADEVEKVNLTQLRLITRDCGMHVSSVGSTYKSVVEVWKVAMKTVQDLISGMPQRISKGAVLVGLSAWHIYPDLNVVGPIAHVKFNDRIVAAGGVITIGLQSASLEEQKGVQWSLSLSHLRFYGDPVNLSATAGDASLRITMRELHYAALGSLFAAWTPYVTDNVSGCEFLLALRNAVGSPDDLDLPWLRLLWDASRCFLDLWDPLEKENACALIALGRRRGHTFFGWEKEFPIRLFGLINPIILDWFAWTPPLHVNTVFDYTMSCITFLREHALAYDLPATEYVIRYCAFYGCTTFQGRPSGDVKSYPRREWYHYTTARLLPVNSSKRDRYGNHREELLHCHWLSSTCPWSPMSDKLYQIDEQTVEFDASKDIWFPHRGYNGKWFEWFRLPSWLGAHRRTHAMYDYVAGNPEEVALFRIRDHKPAQEFFLQDTKVTSFLYSGATKPERLADYLKSYDVAELSPGTYQALAEQAGLRYGLTDSLVILAEATRLYDELPGATVSISVLGTPLHKAKWYHCRSQRWWQRLGVLSRSAKFACIAMFESGNLNLDPDSIQSVMAMSSGNSIFTLTALLQDPSKRQSPHGEVTRILGNLNRPGIVVLVPPQAPLIRKSDPAAWRIVNHAPFDGKSNDHFAHTSLHLSFTQYEMPLIVRTGTVDAEVTVLESLVSVYDRQRWTADIDIVDNFADYTQEWEHQRHYLANGRRFPCTHTPGPTSSPAEEFVKQVAELYDRQLISIDSWEELLDPPERLGTHNIGVFRAAGNWQAKLAAFSVCRQLGYRTYFRAMIQCDECFLKRWSLGLMQIFIL